MTVVDGSKKLAIKRSLPAPLLNPFIEMPELNPQNSCLKLIKAAVEARYEVVVFLLAAMVAEHGDFFGNIRVIGHHHTSITVGAKDLARKKAEAAGVAEGAHAAGVFCIC